MPLFNNMFKYVYIINKNSMFFNIEIYNKYFILYHMFIRHKMHNIL